MMQTNNLTLWTLLALATLGSLSAAQEPEAPATDAAADAGSGNPYFDLRKSKDRVTRQWAERYFNLVKFQEWASDKGTTIKAKYVSHEPNLSSVTLLVVRGSGAGRTEREVTVPVAKLSKSGQSRVKQIDITQKKLDELIAAGATAGADGQAPGQPIAAAGAPMIDEQGAEPTPRRPTTRTRAPRPSAAAADPPAAAATKNSVADDGNPDPLGFAEVPAPSGPPMTATFAAPPGAAPDAVVPENPDLQPVEAAALQDKAAWRTDYNAFLANFRPGPSDEILAMDWGSLKELKEAAEEIQKREADGDVGDEDAAAIKKKFDDAGEFTWEATLVDGDISEGEWTDRLNLPPLPEPIFIAFFLDEQNPGNWQKLKAGDRVRFTGRFATVEDENLIAVIRFLDDKAPAIER